MTKPDLDAIEARCDANDINALVNYARFLETECGCLRNGLAIMNPPFEQGIYRTPHFLGETCKKLRKEEMQEARASVALDHDVTQETCSTRKSALEWLCGDDGYVTVYGHGTYYAANAVRWGGWLSTGPSTREAYNFNNFGKTPALAITACARAAGWPG